MKRSAKDRGRVTAPRDRTPTIITALIVMIVVVISLAAGFAILRERRLSVRETERSTANLARTLEEHSRLTFEAVIQSLRTGAKYIDETPDALRLGNRKTEEALRYLVNAVPYLSDLKVADHNGRLVADVFNQESLGKNFSHRTTFHLLRDDPSRPFVVSEAENSAKYGGWVIFVSIPLLSPAGKFRGVVVGALNVSHFNRFYDAINVGKYGAIKLVRLDGVILTRRPEGFIGKSLAKGPLFVEYIPKSPVGTIDIVATDHAPHPVEDKESEWDAAAMGMLGLETALSVVQAAMIDTGLLEWAGVADRMSYRPARIGRCDTGPHAQGRPIAAGEPANLVLVDPAHTRTISGREMASLSHNTPFEGMKLPGRVVATFLRGRPTVLDGALQ